jgi:hypothetical protein
MEKVYEIAYVENPDKAWDIIGQGIHNYNNQQAGDQNSQILCFVLQGSAHEPMLPPVFCTPRLRTRVTGASPA